MRPGIFLVIAAFVFFAGCNLVKKESKTPTLLKTETAEQSELMSEVNRYARVNSMRAKMDLKFEDNSFAEFGTKEAYRNADGEVVVQRPGMILLKVQAPIFRTDIAVTYLYKLAFEFRHFGQGFALSVCIFVVLIIFSVIYTRLLGAQEEA